jgi:DNA ligase-1
MLYSKLCEIYELLEKSHSRLKKTEILAEFLNELKKEKNREIVYLLQGRVWPDYIEKEFGISGQLTIKALSKASGLNEEKVISKFKKIGDLGEVAADIMESKKQATLFSNKLTTEKVIENLKKLPELIGKGTVDKKIGLISELLTSASAIESKYITRTLMSDLRIGVGSGVIRDAITWSCLDKENKEDFELVQTSYDTLTDFKLVFEKAAKGKKECLYFC